MKKVRRFLFSALCLGSLLSLNACGEKEDSIIEPKITAKNGEADAGVTGPFTVPATLSRVSTNQKIVIQQRVGTLAPGVYICDVYRSSASVTLAQGQLMIYDTTVGASKIGFETPTSQTLGTGSIQQGNTYTFSTYSIVVKYNSIGQQINGGPYPIDLTNNVYAYSIYTI